VADCQEVFFIDFISHTQGHSYYLPIITSHLGLIQLLDGNLLGKSLGHKHEFTSLAISKLSESSQIVRGGI